MKLFVQRERRLTGCSNATAISLPPRLSLVGVDGEQLSMKGQGLNSARRRQGRGHDGYRQRRRAALQRDGHDNTHQAGAGPCPARVCCLPPRHSGWNQLPIQAERAASVKTLSFFKMSHQFDRHRFALFLSPRCHQRGADKYLLLEQMGRVEHLKVRQLIAPRRRRSAQV